MGILGKVQSFQILLHECVLKMQAWQILDIGDMFWGQSEKQGKPTALAGEV